MITIHLNQLTFHAFHGMHEEESVLGNEYVIDCSLGFEENTEVIEHVHDTINYVEVYELIGNRMKVPTPLLETVVMEIGQQLIQKFSNLKRIDIHLKKMHPPIKSIQGSVGVSWHKKF